MSRRGDIRYVAEGPWGTATVYKIDADESTPNLGLKATYSKSRTLLNQYIGTSALSQHVISLHSLADVTKESVEEPEKEIAGALSFLMSSLMCTIFEDAMTQMLVLEQCNNQLKIIKTHADKTALTALKYNVKMPVVTDDLSGIDTNDLGSTIYKIAKLDSDRKYISDILKNTYLELALRRTFFVLSDNMQTIIDRNAYRYGLEVEEARNKVVKRDVIKQVRHQRNRIKSTIYDTDVIISGLNSQVEDSVLCSETASRYVGYWETARTEQHIQTINDTEKLPLTNINFYKQSYEQEVRVHSEVELLVNISINETLTKIEDWMAKYDADLEKIDLKIQLKKNEYKDKLDTRIKMEETLEKHDKMMKDWVHFKDEREKARLYREKMTNAAISVQAWWRGLLVRLQLGPFKPKKKPKGKEGKGKK